MHRWLVVALAVAACGKSSPGSSALTAPTGLHAAGGSGSVTLGWTASDGATAYVVQRGSAAGGPYTPVGTPTAASFADTGLAAGTTFYYVVAATKDTQTSGNSNEASAVTAPAAPTGLSAVATGLNISLSWTAAPSATSYVISRSDSASGTYTQIGTATATSYTDSGLAAGTTFFYKVWAVDAGGAGASSGEAHDTTAPPAPAGVQAVASGLDIEVSWSAAAGAAQYRVSRSASANGTYTQLALQAGTTYSDTGLDAGTTWFYQIIAVNPAGDSAPSAAAHDTTQPLPPTNVHAAATGLSITVTWTASQGAATYKVKRGPALAGPFDDVATVSGASYADAGLAPDTTYFYVVSAANGAGESANSAAAHDSTAPATPASISASAAGTTITVTWSAVATATSYLLARAGGGASTTFTTTDTTYTDSGLALGTTYTYSVAAVNGAGAGQATLSVNATTIPPQPTLSAAGGVQKITLTFGAAGAAAFTLERGTAPDTYDTEFDNATSPYDDTGVDDGAVYYYRVLAANAAGTATASDEVSATTAPSTPALSAEADNTGVTLTFSATGADSFTLKRSVVAGGPYDPIQQDAQSPTLDTDIALATTYYYVVIAHNASGDTQSAEASALTRPAAPSLTAYGVDHFAHLIFSADGAVSYTLFRGTASGELSQVASAVTSPYDDTGLAAGTLYYYAVEAFNSGGGTFSDQQVALTIPPVPANVQVTPGDSSVQVSWDAAQAATSYDVVDQSSGSNVTVATVNGTSATIGGLTNGNQYCYVVHSTNASGHSLNSSPAVCKTPEPGPPATPALSAAGGTRAVTLTFSAAGATSFTLKRGTATGIYGTTINSVTSPYSDITGLSDGTTYYYVVVAHNGGGDTQSLEASAITAPAAPGGVTAQGGNVSAQVSWSQSTGAATYDVFYGTGTGPYTTAGPTGITALTTAVNGLTNGTSYCFVVQAVNAGGRSVSSSPSNCVTPSGVPAAPTLTLGTVSSGSVALSWNSVTNANGYRLFRADLGTTPLVDQTTLTYTDTSAINETTYSYYVVAYNGVGPGIHSNTVTATPHAPLTAPGSPTAYALDSAVRLGWSAVTRATSYDILRGTAPGGESATAVGNSATLTYTDSTAANGTTYYYEIRARVDATSETGPASSEVSATPIRELCVATSAPYALALDADGRSADSDGTEDVRRTFGGSTMLFRPQSIALDAVNGEIYALNADSNAITVHSTSASGDAAPSRIIAGAATGLNLNGYSDIAVDPGLNTAGSNFLFVLSSDTLATFARTASGNATPQRTWSLSGAQRILVDPVVRHWVYVASGGGGGNSVFLNAYDELTVNGDGTPQLKAQTAYTVTKLQSVTGLALDTAHSKLWVLTVDPAGAKLSSVASDLTGSVSTFTGDATFDVASGLALDTATDELVMGQATRTRIVAFNRTTLSTSGANPYSRTLAMPDDPSGNLATPTPSNVALDVGAGKLWLSADNTLSNVPHGAMGTATLAGISAPITDPFINTVSIASDPDHQELWLSGQFDDADGFELIAAFPRTSAVHNSTPVRTNFFGISSMAYDRTDGELYLGSGGVVESVARTSTDGSYLQRLVLPSGLVQKEAFDSGELFVATPGNGVHNDEVLVYARAGDGTLSLEATLTGTITAPDGIYVDSTEILVTDTSGAITGFPRTHPQTAQAASRHITQTGTLGSHGVLKDASGNIYVLNGYSFSFGVSVFGAAANGAATPLRKLAARGAPAGAGGLAWCN